MAAKRRNGAGTVYRRVDGRFEASWHAQRDGSSERRHAYFHDEGSAWQRLTFELGLEALAPGTYLPDTIRAAVEHAARGDLSRVVRAEDGSFYVGNSDDHAHHLAGRLAERRSAPLDLVHLRNAVAHLGADLNRLAAAASDEDLARIVDLGPALLACWAQVAEQLRRARRDAEDG